MVKTIELGELGKIESQRQIDEFTKQCVVGEPLLEFESLNVGTGLPRQDFRINMMHQVIESLVIQVHQLADESGEVVENEEEIRAYLVATIRNNLNLLTIQTDSDLQPLRCLLDAYLTGSYGPEIVTAVFAFCSMDFQSDHKTNPLDSALDLLAKHHRTHAEAFIKALKHAWNPLLDKRLKETLDGIEDPGLKETMETVIAFRNDNQGIVENHPSKMP